MNLLALDLGGQCGYAMRSRGITTSGTVSFAPRARDGVGQRWLRFRAFLTERATGADLGAVYVEQPIHFAGRSGTTTLVLGGYLAVLELWCAANQIQLHAVSISAVKKHWTGRGDAKKPDMIRFARQRGLKPADDNEADALALLDYARCAERDAGVEAGPLFHVEPAPLVDERPDPFAKVVHA